MQIIEVKSETQEQKFLDVVDKIYKGDEAYVRPLDDMIKETFSPATNDFFQYGEATRFLLLDYDDEVIGRVAA
jgi:hypothetical protein